MTERTDILRHELDSLFREATGDDGKILIAPTKKDREEVLAAVENIPNEVILSSFAVVSGQLVSGILTQMGKRPADYWRDEKLAKAVSSRIGKALQGKAEVFTVAFQAALKGGG